MTNEGQDKYEAISERLGGQAATIVLDQASQVDPGSLAVDDSVRLTLLGGLLMVIQWKVRTLFARATERVPLISVDLSWGRLGL